MCVLHIVKKRMVLNSLTYLIGHQTLGFLEYINITLFLKVLLLSFKLNRIPEEFTDDTKQE